MKKKEKRMIIILIIISILIITSILIVKNIINKKNINNTNNNESTKSNAIEEVKIDQGDYAPSKIDNKEFLKQMDEQYKNKLIEEIPEIPVNNVVSISE